MNKAEADLNPTDSTDPVILILWMYIKRAKLESDVPEGDSSVNPPQDLIDKVQG